MAEADATHCVTCRLNRGELPAPGDVIYQNDFASHKIGEAGAAQGFLDARQLDALDRRLFDG